MPYTPMVDGDILDAADINGIQDRIEQVNTDLDLKASKIYVQSSAGNLITNGTGRLKNNENFSMFTFDPTDFATGSGSFDTQMDVTGNYFTDELIIVDPAMTYELEGYVKQKGGVSDARFYFGIAPFDTDGIAIGASTYMYQTGTTTRLAQALNPGDTVVRLQSAANWNNNTVNGYQRSLIIYGYQSTGGATYEDYGYSRYFYTDVYDNGAVNYSTNTITLREPWAGPAFPAGRAIANGTAGGNYKYIAAANDILPNNGTWTRYSGTISGMSSGGTAPNDKWPPGTSYAAIMCLPNRNVTGSKMSFSGISFRRIPDERYSLVTHNHDSAYAPLSHASLTNNPHNVTRAQLGLGTAPLDIIPHVVSYNVYGSTSQITTPVQWYTAGANLPAGTYEYSFICTATLSRSVTTGGMELTYRNDTDAVNFVQTVSTDQIAVNSYVTMNVVGSGNFTIGATTSVVSRVSYRGLSTAGTTGIRLGTLYILYWRIA